MNSNRRSKLEESLKLKKSRESGLLRWTERGCIPIVPVNEVHGAHFQSLNTTRLNLKSCWVDHERRFM